MARETTSPTAPASPPISRSTSSASIVGANAHSRDVTAYRATPTSSGRRRPIRSLKGPTSSCPTASPIMQTDMDAWPSASVVPRSAVSRGSAGR
ncbi:MAG: hypothetical protein JWP64_3522 [Pseudonocardia sp.]|jgi:hypothetical protein|nr:hypothetical protein [Pseudonocardia sp.]MDT7703213.1 hypothetical protein [Pseudonocardiales bacterium]